MFRQHGDAWRNPALWRDDYSNVRPHLFLEYQTPAAARREREEFQISAHKARFQNEDYDYEAPTGKLSL